MRPGDRFKCLFAKRFLQRRGRQGFALIQQGLVDARGLDRLKCSGLVVPGAGAAPLYEFPAGDFAAFQDRVLRVFFNSFRVFEQRFQPGKDLPDFRVGEQRR